MSQSPIPALAAALLDPSAPGPVALRVCNGSDPRARLGVYRNNVVHSLTGVLSDTFTVVRQLVGDDFFSAMAAVFVRARPPRSPLMHRYGEGFAEWLCNFEPAQELPYLPDLARLEFARWQALHAADVAPLRAQALANALGDTQQAAHARVVLHPCAWVIQSAYPIVTLWGAHQGDEAARDTALQSLDLDCAESALVFRAGDDALVLPLSTADASLAGALHRGQTLGQAAASHAQADMAAVLGTLLAHELIIDVQLAWDAMPVSIKAVS